MTRKRKSPRSASRGKACALRNRTVKARRWPDKLRGDRFPIDPMAMYLKDIVRPRLLDARRAAARAWCVTLGGWAESEVAATGHDTERVERLIERAWRACCDCFCAWDPRFALQAIRTLPPQSVSLIGQSIGDQVGLLGTLRLLTAAALSSGGDRWPRGEEAGRNWIDLEPAQWRAVTERLPDVLGRAIGNARLLFEAQRWYRLTGKGKPIRRMPEPFTPVDERTVMAWTGDGVLILPVLELDECPDIDRAVGIYERRKAVADGGFYSAGLLQPTPGEVPAEVFRFWGLGVASASGPPLPVRIPTLDLTFPAPGYWPMVDLDLGSWVDALRPFDALLRNRTGLDCDQLLLGLRALGLVVERQTQCGWLRPGTWRGRDALILDSPSDPAALTHAAEHLASVLLRGMLRVSRASFRAHMVAELVGLGSAAPKQTADAILSVFSGIPEHHRLPKPVLFFIPDDLTYILDLSLWSDFKSALLAWVTTGEDTKGETDNKGNLRGGCFEEQARQALIVKLGLGADAIPWPANRNVREGGQNLGDVDFCFLRSGILFNLDMKSWQRTDGYHIGHFHAIQNRQKDLVKAIGKVDRRGAALLGQLLDHGSEVQAVLNILVVAFPEYLATDYPSLWYGQEPRVVTAAEVIALANDRDRVLAMVKSAGRSAVKAKAG